MGTVVLTRPAAPGIPGTIRTGVTVPPLTTVAVDACSCGNNMSLKWMYTLMDSTSEEVLTGEIVANHNFGNTPRWNRYGLVGDRMLHTVEVTLPGSPSTGDLELQITNNNATNTYTVNIVRIQMLS